MFVMSMVVIINTVADRYKVSKYKQGVEVQSVQSLKHFLKL